MNKPNAVKFNFLALKTEVKNIVMISLDHDVSISYPQLKDAPELVKVKGISSIGDFELFVNEISEKSEDFLSKLRFVQRIKFKLIEIEQNPVELPTGAEKEVNQKPSKK